MSEAGAVAAPITYHDAETHSQDASTNGHGAQNGTTSAESKDTDLSQIPGSSSQHTAQNGSLFTDSARPDSDQPGAGRCFYDYSNGGPRFDDEHSQQDEPCRSGGGCRVLAQYCDLPGAVAAVACPVGRGRAVLCGTHPELATHWLGAVDPPIDATPHAGQQSCTGSAATVKAKLEQTQALREQFWLGVLRACGLGQHVACT